MLQIEQPEKTCRLGQGKKCCSYLVLGPKGFECAKGDPVLFSAISHKIEAGAMQAKGLGAWPECSFSKEEV